MKQIISVAVVIAALLAAVAQGRLIVSTDSVPDKTTKKSSSNNASFLVPIKLVAKELGGSVALENIMIVSMGTPAQSVPVIFDTGSYWPVIWNASCTDVGCGTEYHYNSGLSTSAIVSSKVSINNFGAGHSQGVYCQDTISMMASSGPDGGSFTMFKNFSLIQVTKWRKTAPIQAFGLDGFFGMGPPISPEITRGPNSTTAQMLRQGMDVFAIRIPRGSFQTGDEGQVQFGGYDLLTKKTCKTWAPIVKSPFLAWTIVIQDVLHNGVSTGACTSYHGECLATIDTGAGGMGMYGYGLPYIPGSDGQSINCSQTHTLPNVSLVIEGTTFTFEPQDYVQQLPNGLCQSGISGGGGSASRNLADNVARKQNTRHSRSHLGQIFPQPAGQEQQQQAPRANNYLGVMLQARAMTIFDIKNGRIGFIQHD